jgi:hypothetical protein
LTFIATAEDSASMWKNSMPSAMLFSIVRAEPNLSHRADRIVSR